jgi:hypothetical protein
MFSIVTLIVGIIIIAFHHDYDDCSDCEAAPQICLAIDNYFPLDLKQLLFASISRSALDDRAPPCDFRLD